MRPDVGAVVIHEDGDIAHDADGPLGAVAPQCAPLLVKGELEGAANLDIVGELFTRFFQGSGLAVSEIVRPPVPALEFLLGTKRVEQNEVVEPPGIVRLKTLETP